MPVLARLSVCVPSRAGQAVKKLLIFFLTTCMRLSACVLVPTPPLPSSSLSLSAPPAHLGASCWSAAAVLIAVRCLCGVYTAFAFDKVNQKFFNPFCIQANIDRHTHTYTHVQGSISHIRMHGQKGIVSLLCVLIILSPLALQPLWVPAARSNFSRAAKWISLMLNYMYLFSWKPYSHSPPE